MTKNLLAPLSSLYPRLCNNLCIILLYHRESYTRSQVQQFTNYEQKWYTLSPQKPLFTSSFPTSSHTTSSTTLTFDCLNYTGRNRSSIRLGSATLKLQEPPILLQRERETLAMGATTRNRYREAQVIHGRAPLSTRSQARSYEWKWEQWQDKGCAFVGQA